MVEFRDVKTKEESIEQIEEQGVIEAKIRMRQQELQDEEERMQKRQDISSSSSIVRSGDVEYSAVAESSSAIECAVEGEEIVSSQHMSPNPSIRHPLRLRQNRYAILRAKETFGQIRPPTTKGLRSRLLPTYGGGRSGGRSFYVRGGSRGCAGGSRGYSESGAFSPDKIDSLGRLMTRILRHMASKLNLEMRNDGYVKVRDLLKLDLYTVANIPLNSHTIADVREAVMADKKQRFSLVEENGELFIRANQGHTLKAVKTESLLKPIVSAEKVPVCVHGTYRENLQSILEHGLKRMKRLHIHFACGLPKDSLVISGMRHNVNVLIFLDVKKALEEGMKLYFSENKVVLTEGFNGVIPAKYFEKIESQPGRQLLYVSKDKDLVPAMQDLTIKRG